MRIEYLLSPLDHKYPARNESLGKLLRVRFPDGMQRQFVEDTKKRSGLTWKEFRNSLRIGSHVCYRYEICSLPLRVFTRALRISGTSRREAEKFEYGIVKQPSEIVLKLRKEKTTAELVGICLGDGHLRPYTMMVFGDKSNDTSYLHCHVQPIIQSALGLTARLNTNRPTENFLVINSIAATRSLHRLGLPYGDKIANHARIPNWIFSRKSWLIACLRGLFDTDGCVYGFRRIPPVRGSKAIISFEFGNGSLLAKNVHRALRRLGYSPRMMPHRNECRLAVNKDIARFMKEVQPANLKHHRNFERWYGPVV